MVRLETAFVRRDERWNMISSFFSVSATCVEKRRQILESAVDLE